MAERARISAGLFALVFLGHAYFAGGLGWNQSARVAATLTFVEPGPNRFTMRIDGFIADDRRNLLTGDWARGADRHFYSNKAPGVSVLGIPAYAALYAIETLAGLDPRSEPLTRTNTILLNLWCTALWTAAATVLLCRFLVASGQTARSALVGGIAFAFGTLVFPYGTSIWGHTTAAAFVLASLCLAWWPGGPRRPALAGLFGGLAVATEYVAVFPLAVAGCALLAPRRSWGDRLAFGAGAALPLLALLAYQHAVFGAFWIMAPSQSNPVFLEPGRGLGLIGRFDASALPGLTVSPYRGLFLFSPVLLLAFAGARQALRAGRVGLVFATLGGFAACLFFLATVNYWWGGMANGPRYLIVAIPLLALLAPDVSALSRAGRALHHLALAVSLANMLAITATEPMVDENERNPLYGLTYRELISGIYPHNTDTRNLGMWLGLAPRWDLLPWAAGFALGATWLLREARPRG